METREFQITTPIEKHLPALENLAILHIPFAVHPTELRAYYIKFKNYAKQILRQAINSIFLQKK